MGEFILKTIEFTLDEASIQRAIDEIHELQVGLKDALDGLCEYLLEHGQTVARINLMRFGAMRTGALYNSIRYGAFDRSKGVGVLTAGEGLLAGGIALNGSPYSLGSYAVYVEYGFGVEGKSSKHPNAKQQRYKYNINKNTIQVRDRSQPGEVYTNVPGWTYFNERENKFFFSRGQPAKPFMYNTLLDLIDIAEREGGRIIAQYIP